MIRKVPGLNAWVLKPKDFETLWKVNIHTRTGYLSVFELPILDIHQNSITAWFYQDESNYTSDYVLATLDPIIELKLNWDFINFPWKIKEEYIDIINETWNRCYD